MQSEVTGKVTDVQGRPVKSGTIFDVTIGDKKVSTFKAPVAEKANALKGQNVTATVDVTQNGQYTNYTLLDIAASSNGPIPTQAQRMEAATQPTSIPVAAKNTDDATAARIARSVAFEHLPQYLDTEALPLMASPDELYEALDSFAKWIYSGAREQTLDDAIQQQGLEQAVGPAKVVSGGSW